VLACVRAFLCMCMRAGGEGRGVYAWRVCLARGTSAGLRPRFHRVTETTLAAASSQSGPCGAAPWAYLPIHVVRTCVQRMGHRVWCQMDGAGVLACGVDGAGWAVVICRVRAHRARTWMLSVKLDAASMYRCTHWTSARKERASERRGGGMEDVTRRSTRCVTRGCCVS
jgi:hypothetical protein